MATTTATEYEHEALNYVSRNRSLIQAERAREAADIRSRGLDRYLRGSGQK